MDRPNGYLRQKKLANFWPFKDKSRELCRGLATIKPPPTRNNLYTSKSSRLLLPQASLDRTQKEVWRFARKPFSLSAKTSSKEGTLRLQTPPNHQTKMQELWTFWRVILKRMWPRGPDSITTPKIQPSTSSRNRKDSNSLAAQWRDSTIRHCPRRQIRWAQEPMKEPIHKVNLRRLQNLWPKSRTMSVLEVGRVDLTLQRLTQARTRWEVWFRAQVSTSTKIQFQSL